MRLSIKHPIVNFLFVNGIIAFFIAFILCRQCFSEWTIPSYLPGSYLFSFLASCTFSFGSNKIASVFDQYISWLKKPILRLILQLTATLIYFSIVTILLVITFLLYKGFMTMGQWNWELVISESYTPTVIGISIVILLTGYSFLKEWKNAALETEKLKTEQYALKYQSLRDQLNPHFLFNSLNVLSGLVYENADNASLFIRKLSKVYRYVLEVQGEELVILQKEIEFAHAYLDLQKVRFEENIAFTIHVPDEYKSLQIPPLSLQLLLENAVKHNYATNKNPLVIEISVNSEKELIVSNNTSDLPSSAPIVESTGIGLRNIEKRYELLSNKKVSINQLEGRYEVKLPLLSKDQQSEL